MMTIISLSHSLTLLLPTLYYRFFLTLQSCGFLSILAVFCFFFLLSPSFSVPSLLLLLWCLNTGRKSPADALDLTQGDMTLSPWQLFITMKAIVTWSSWHVCNYCHLRGFSKGFPNLLSFSYILPWVNLDQVYEDC